MQSSNCSKLSALFDHDENDCKQLDIHAFLSLKLLHEPHAYHKQGIKCIYQDLIRKGYTIREIIFHIVNEPEYLDDSKYEWHKSLKYDHLKHYIYCIKFGFRHGIANWRQSSKELMSNIEYYADRKEMLDEEIRDYLQKSPIMIKDDTITDGLHRSMCMIGRIIKGQGYIPFYYEGYCKARKSRRKIPNYGYRRKQNIYRLNMMLPSIEKNCFKLIDIGSNYGYFSLNLANIFPNSQVFSVEGSYGTGNPENKGFNVQIAMKKRFFLYNNFIYDHLFSDDLIREFNDKSIVFDYQLSLSVFHWIVYLTYGNNGTSSAIEEMMINHLKMSEVTFIELPCKSQQTSLSPFYENYGSLDDMFISLSKIIPLQFKKLGECEWYGKRELFCITLFNHKSTVFTPQQIDTLLNKSV